MVLTTTNLVFRVFTASLIGAYTFVELFLSFLVTFAVLKVTEKCEENAEKRSEDQERIPEETSLTIENEKERQKMLKPFNWNHANPARTKSTVLLNQLRTETLSRAGTNQLRTKT